MKRNYLDEAKDDTTTCTTSSGSETSCCFLHPIHVLSSGGNGGSHGVGGASVTSSQSAPLQSRQGGSNDNDAAPSETEKLISEGLQNMSFQERDVIYEEVHGVGRVVQENPEFVESKLSLLDRHLQLISNKDAYNRAYFLSRAFVQDRDFRLMFLRADQFDARQSAKRIVAHFEHKLKYFGMGCVARRLQWSDLTPDDKELVKSGCFHMFPDCCDSIGRLLCVNVFKYRTGKVKNDASFSRAFWYIAMQAIERSDEVAQRKGSVPVLYPLDTSYSDLRREVIREARNVVFDTLPGRVTGAHMCFSNGLVKNLFSALVKAAPREVRARTKIHGQSHLECQYHLNSFGITADVFPVDGDGNLKRKLLDERLQALHDDETERIRAEQSEREERLENGEGIARPNENDILCGRGSIRCSFTGNIAFTTLLETNLKRYQAVPQSDRASKSAITEDLLETLRANGARFLEYRKDLDDGLWYEVSRKTARDKIAMGFRNATRREKKKTNHHPSEEVVSML